MNGQSSKENENCLRLDTFDDVDHFIFSFSAVKIVKDLHQSIYIEDNSQVPRMNTICVVDVGVRGCV